MRTDFQWARGVVAPLRSRAVRSGLAAAAGLAVIVGAASWPAGSAGATCVKQTVDSGIVKAIGCWTQSTVGGATVYTAAFADQPDGVDLNGFIVTGPNGGGLRINSATRQVTSVALSAGTNLDLAQLNSKNWPIAGQLTPLGQRLKLDFIAPTSSGLLLEDLQFDSNTFVKALAGLSPVGTIETPVRLESSGKGSLDLSVLLAGIFTLKGKPQSVTISLETESEEGTKFDGFEIKLKEIDAIEAFKLNDLEAEYSASKKTFGGSANASFPFMAGRGLGVGFAVTDGTITDVSVSGAGLKIPIGAPPAGFITDIAGGLHVETRKEGEAGPVDIPGWCHTLGKQARLDGSPTGSGAAFNWHCDDDGVSINAACRWQYGSSAISRLDDPNNANGWRCVGGVGGTFLLANAKLGATFGPTLPSPFGDIAPIKVNAALDIGYAVKELLVRIHGGVEIFRLPVGDVYLAIHSDSGVEFGAGLGIGFPDYTNNDNDPFYVGAHVDGWVAKQKFQLEGRGRVALFGTKLLDADILVNDRATGACWTVLGAAGGAVFEYGSSGPRTFGIGCGLDEYREQFPAGATASAASPRSFSLTGADRVLTLKGKGAPPRFSLRAKDGRVIHTPTTGRSSLTKDYAFFINDYTDTTNVVLRSPKGVWTVVPDRGSPTITSLKAARNAPKEQVTATVTGTGRTRTLTWRSKNRAHTRLQFTEMLPDGHEIPIFETDGADGSRRFTVAKGYGARRIRVIVKHGFGSRQSGVVANYQVLHPRTLRGPAGVAARRDGHTVFVSWPAVAGASGYLVEVSIRQGGKLRSNYVRRVSAGTRSVVIPHHPGAGGGTATAKVFALNEEGALGAPGSRAFLTNPTARTLREAASRSVQSAARHGSRVDVRTQCPPGGHCQVHVELLRDGKRVAVAEYQQTPDTFRSVGISPSSAATRRAVQQGSGRLRVVVIVKRSAGNAMSGAQLQR